MNFTTFTHIQENDLRLLCKRVPEFPANIDQAFLEMERVFADYVRDGYYGISWMEGEKVIYHACAPVPENIPDGNYDPFILKKGNYIAVELKNWMQQLPMIKEAFMFLMKDPRFDYNYPCAEWYKSDDEMLIMVRMKEEANGSGYVL
ncbi:hypothetical protein [Pollutibacter soli]|uniref:hypothetical protein n=1 Tax=Pollutibacter soli TaxID=3034157 RepID=UPI00301340B2